MEDARKKKSCLLISMGWLALACAGSGTGKEVVSARAADKADGAESFAHCAVMNGSLHVAGPGANLGSLPAGECVRLTGSLYIRGLEGERLPPLGRIARVDGSVWISANPRLQTLAGLEGLASIGKSLLLYDNPTLWSLDGTPDQGRRRSVHHEQQLPRPGEDGRRREPGSGQR